MKSEVTKLKFNGNRVSDVCTSEDDCTPVHGVVSGADYHHVEQKLLPYSLRTQSPEFWEKQV